MNFKKIFFGLLFSITIVQFTQTAEQFTERSNLNRQISGRNRQIEGRNQQPASAPIVVLQANNRIPLTSENVRYSHSERERLLTLMRQNPTTATQIRQRLNNVFDSNNNNFLSVILMDSVSEPRLIRDMLEDNLLLGLDVNHQNNNGDTPLDLALQRYNADPTTENREIVRLLLDTRFETDIDLLNPNNRTLENLNLIQSIVHEQHARTHMQALQYN